MMDLISYCSVKHSIFPRSSSATVTGVSIDTAGFNECLVVLSSGTTAATGTLDVTIEGSKDDTAWAAIAGAAFVQVTPSNDEAVYVAKLNLGTNDANRYLRAVGTAATAASVYGVSFILGGKREPWGGDAAGAAFQLGLL